MSGDRKAHIRQELAEARRLLLEAAAAIDDETAVASTENPQWRVRDILAHLAGAERGLLRTVERFLAGAELPPAFSLDIWNQRQVDKRQPSGVAELVAELSSSREEAWAMLDRLSEREMNVVGLHPAGRQTTVAGLFLTIAYHELDHGNEIRQALALPITQQADWSRALAPLEAPHG
jgi:uncharacterized protein (TIGR03083 family)